MVVVMALKRKEKKERCSKRSQLRVTLGYSVAHVAGWGTDTGAHNCASTEDRTRNLSRASVCTCGAAQMEKSMSKTAAHYSPVSSSNLGTSPVILLRPKTENAF